MIHTIGDSHAGGVDGINGAFDKISGIIRHWLGPKLMFSISRDGLDIKSLNIKNGETIIFCFGEIDCRCHVHKYKNDSSLEEVIEKIVFNYFIFLSNLKKLFPLSRFCIYNVLPPVKKELVEENISYPFLGSDSERKSYVIHMNNILRKYCKTENMTFIDIYDDYSCEDGFLKREYSDGNVHITEHSFLYNFLKKNKII
jgi:hypothetical protein